MFKILKNTLVRADKGHKKLIAVCSGRLKICIHILPVRSAEKNPQWPSAFYTL